MSSPIKPKPPRNPFGEESITSIKARHTKWCFQTSNTKFLLCLQHYIPNTSLSFPPTLHINNLYSPISFYITLKPHNLYTLKPHNLYSPQPQISFHSASFYKEIPSMNIALSLSPITSLDTHFPSSLITPPSHPHKKIKPYNHSLHSTKCVITTTT